MNDARRALVLAGGGMRVAWQAGVVLALDEAGVRFGHLDGTSGGIMNTAALMSGVEPGDLCERWETLKVSKFASPLPLLRYLRAPNLLAWGDADGVVGHVFPHLGIDIEAVNSRVEPTATFNVCNFDDKVSVAISNGDVTVDHLVAGMSLPIAMPPVERDGITWTDAVWIRDANLLEAESRGAKEIWLAWCIGNTGRYGEGPLEQYVHMIEMSAAGALNAELASIDARNAERSEPVRVHVIKPRHPLPLDPELMLGRIDAATLVEMGYRDARVYLASRLEVGVPLDIDASKMIDPEPGIRFRDESHGTLSGMAARLRIGAEIHGVEELSADQQPRPAVGSVRLGERTHYFANATIAWKADGTMEVAAELEIDGSPHRLVAQRRFGADGGVHRRVWAGLSGCEVTLTDDDGVVLAEGRLATKPGGAAKMVTSMEPSAVHGLRDRVRVVRALGRLTRRSLRAAR